LDIYQFDIRSQSETDTRSQFLFRFVKGELVAKPLPVRRRSLALSLGHSPTSEIV
jgi:hypothetical protein